MLKIGSNICGKPGWPRWSRAKRYFRTADVYSQPRGVGFTGPQSMRSDRNLSCWHDSTYTE